MRKMILFGMILLSTLITSMSGGADETSRRSQGCGRAAPATAPVSIEVGGRTREFIFVVPESYDSDVSHRLIFAFHGRLETALEEFDELLDTLADAATLDQRTVDAQWRAQKGRPGDVC